MGKALLTRRQFLSLVASGVAAELLLPHCDAELQKQLQDDGVHLKKRESRENRSYGSGNFGDWITDPQGLPCYHYLCNQTEDPTAITPVEPAWRTATDHTHQIGNDRIIAAASNYGYVQVRQDEGGARFLNDYKPSSGLFGAGLGYLTDGREVLGTYFPGTGTSFERFFGMGYLRKQTLGRNYTVDQTIYAPFGDDPVLISEVTISSQSPNAANLHWAEYWGCQIYPFSYQAFVDGHNAGAIDDPPDPEKIAKLRRELAAGYVHRFERLTGTSGLLESKQSLRSGIPATGVAIQEELANDSILPGNSPSGNSVSGGGDSLPPPTFLISLDDGPVQCLTNAVNFFGPANALRHTGAAGPDSVPVPAEALRPAGLTGMVPGNGVPQPLAPDDLSATGPESALILVKPFILDAGQTVTLRFLYGYLPEGFSAAKLKTKYRAQANGLFAKSCAAWKDEGIRLTADSDPWIERETCWHSYYLRSGFTYDNSLQEHILSQGQVYQYCIGYQGAARDPLQHALPLIFGESALAKQVLRSTLKSQGSDGALPFAITGDGQAVVSKPPPSDLDLWLLWLASEYVLATRDAAFLEERLSNSPFQSGNRSGAPQSVRERLNVSYRHLVDTIGTGKHGLLRGLNGDWNEQIYFRNLPAGLHEEIGRESESVMNSAMAAYVLDHYGRMLRFAGDADSAGEAEARAEQQRAAVASQWAGSWFKRAWLGPTAGWLGEDRLWLDGQPWALLGGCASEDQRKLLIPSIDRQLRKPSKIGAKQIGNGSEKPLNWPGVMPGETKNGGVYDTLDGPLIWALAGSDPEMAWDEWIKNTRARHAEVYRDVWYGIWSGPDVFCSSDSDHAGQTGFDWGLVDPEAHRRPNSYRGLSWTAWPVMNMHRHAWPLYSLAKLLGVEFTKEGLDLRPSIPKPQYSFHSRLLGLEKNAAGYSGWYAPLRAGNWTIRIRLAASESLLHKLEVNEASQPLIRRPDGEFEFKGSSTLERPLRWSISNG